MAILIIFYIYLEMKMDEKSKMYRQNYIKFIVGFFTEIVDDVTMFLPHSLFALELK